MYRRIAIPLLFLMFSCIGVSAQDKPDNAQQIPDLSPERPPGIPEDAPWPPSPMKELLKLRPFAEQLPDVPSDVPIPKRG